MCEATAHVTGFEPVPVALNAARDRYGAIVNWVDRPARDGPLQGLRVGIKDLIAVAGVPRLCGAPDMVDATPQAVDAPAVARLVEAGARIVATTATHEFGWGVLTPGTRNPRAPGRIAGGSSGGSAAALAGGIVDGALGSDTAGSIRIPAACCGVVGIRPTEGLVPREGVQPLAPSFDNVGPMARDVDTVTRLHAVLSGVDEQPATPERLRVGYLRDVADAPLDGDVRTAWNDTMGALRGAADVRDLTLGELERAAAATATILASEEIKVHAATLDTYGALLSPGVRDALERSRLLSNDEVLEARRTAAAWRNRMVGVFREVDVLVLPVLPCRVPEVGAKVVPVGDIEERVGSALTRLNTPWSLAGLPAGAVPVAHDGGGAPIGLQIVGAWRTDAVVLAAMALIERLAGGPWPAVSS